MPTGPLADRSGAIASAAAAQDVAAANPNRRYLLVQNASSGDLWVDLGADAVLDSPSIVLGPRDALVFESGLIPTDRVSVRGATAGQKFTAKEG